MSTLNKNIIYNYLTTHMLYRCIISPQCLINETLTVLFYKGTSSLYICIIFFIHGLLSSCTVAWQSHNDLKLTSKSEVYTREHQKMSSESKAQTRLGGPNINTLSKSKSRPDACTTLEQHSINISFFSRDSSSLQYPPILKKSAITLHLKII